MPNRARITLAATAVLIGLSACEAVTGPDPLVQFNWTEADPGETVEDGIDIETAAGDIFLLGGINTPTRCYSLAADLQQDDERLTLRVEATSRNASNCAETPGVYTYTAVIRALDAGTYELHVVHAVSSGETSEFTETVTLD